MTDDSSKPLRVGTYNIKGGVHPDDRARETRDLQLLAEHKLDVLALQFSDRRARDYRFDLRASVTDMSATVAEARRVSTGVRVRWSE